MPTFGNHVFSSFKFPFTAELCNITWNDCVWWTGQGWVGSPHSLFQYNTQNYCHVHFWYLCFYIFMVLFQCHKKHQCPVRDQSRSFYVCSVSSMYYFPDSWIGMRCNTANQTCFLILLLKGHECYNGVLKQKLWYVKND
jgi:hypothetical protein